jgi:hypothetical protein
VSRVFSWSVFAGPCRGGLADSSNVVRTCWPKKQTTCLLISPTRTLNHPPHPPRTLGVQILSSDQVGAAFDPAIHEAVMRQPAPPGVEEDSVLSVLRSGYAVGDKLIRAALVIVAQD